MESYDLHNLPTFELEQNNLDDDEDVHVCGKCGGKFTNLSSFITHKRNRCAIQSESSNLNQTDIGPSAGFCQKYEVGESSSKEQVTNTGNLLHPTVVNVSVCKVIL